MAWERWYMELTLFISTRTSWVLAEASETLVANHWFHFCLGRSPTICCGTPRGLSNDKPKLEQMKLGSFLSVAEASKTMMANPCLPLSKTLLANLFFYFCSGLLPTICCGTPRGPRSATSRRTQGRSSWTLPRTSPARRRTRTDGRGVQVRRYF